MDNKTFLIIIGIFVSHLFFSEHPIWRLADVDFIHCIVGKNLRKKMSVMLTLLLRRMMEMLMVGIVKMMMRVTLVVAAAVAACFLVGKDSKILSRVTWEGGK